MSTELTYSSVKIAHHVREQVDKQLFMEEKKAQERKKHLLCLVANHLREEGYLDSAQAVCLESGIGDQYEVCDNIDLASIVKDFEAYYYVRFQKYPKLCKRINTAPEVAKNHTRKKVIRKSQSTVDSSGSSIAPVERVHASSELTVLAIPLNGSPKHCGNTGGERDPFSGDSSELPFERLLKPLAGLSVDKEWRQFAEIISRDIFVCNPNVRWSDIKGLDEPKRLLKEAVVYPIKYPELFNGILTPWKGLLLYGPSGTGKTSLAKAVATECKTTFFNMSASTLVSKWRGDSEKLVRVLFELARHHAPSTVFLDEVDALAGRRGGPGEHEASRRLQAELLVQLDGLNDQPNERVFLLATSNLPWELDDALLRRLEKRILVDLPSADAREEILRHLLPPEPSRLLPGLRCRIEYQQLAQESEGYSGADLRLVCKEAAMQSVRKVFNRLELDVHGTNSIQLEVVTTEAVREALSRTKPCGSVNLPRLRSWQEQFGAQ